MKDYQKILDDLTASGNLRSLPHVSHDGKWIERDGLRMLNLSSNDYLGLANQNNLREEFLDYLQTTPIPLTSSSSRLLTGNFSAYEELEDLLAAAFGRESALIFNSGYHANTGILPALADNHTLLVADKLVHASIIDGLLLSKVPFVRYRHNDYASQMRCGAVCFANALVFLGCLFRKCVVFWVLFWWLRFFGLFLRGILNGILFVHFLLLCYT